MPEPTDSNCEHLDSIVDHDHGAPAFCEDCLIDAASGVILRLCLTCGHAGCGEGSPGDHAAQHYAETDHPIAATVGSKPSRWCYPDGRSV